MSHRKKRVKLGIIKWLRANKNVVIFLTAIILLCSGWMILLITWEIKLAPYPDDEFDSFWIMSVVDSNDSYLIHVVDSIGSPDYSPSDTIIAIEFPNSLLEFQLLDIPNSVEKNLSYYDNDESGGLSVGDSFCLEKGIFPIEGKVNFLIIIVYSKKDIRVEVGTVPT